MKRLYITFRKDTLIDRLLVNGRNIKAKYDHERSQYVAIVETDAPSVQLSLDPFHPLLQPGWWFINVFFFILTVFGIFDARCPYKWIMRFDATVYLDQPEQRVSLMVLTHNPDKVLQLESNCEIETKENRMDYSDKLRRRRTALGWSKALIAIGIVVGLALIFFYFIR